MPMGAKTLAELMSGQDARKRSRRFACCPVVSGTWVGSSMIWVSSYAIDKSAIFAFLISFVRVD